MDLEAALETQRLRLLRLVAGLLMAVGCLSGGSLRLPLPQSLRSFFASVLTRAELAGNNLVSVAVCLQGGACCGVSADMPQPPRWYEDGDAPSVAALMRRMATLRAILEDLSGAARRVMRKMARRTRSDEQGFGHPLPPCPAPLHAEAQSKPKCLAPRMAWPPDRQRWRRKFGVITSPRIRAGGKGDLVGGISVSLEDYASNSASQ